MTRLVWDDLAAREYSAGVDRGVVYPKTGTPVAWNGLVSVTEGVEDADHQISYFDGQAYVQRRAVEGFRADVEAVTYPQEIDQSVFDISYRVQVEDGYVIHLVYNAKLAPADIGYATLDDGGQATTFKWTLTTTPEQIGQVRAASHVIIHTADTTPAVLEAILDLIYGADGITPRIPHLPELRDIYEAGAVFQVVDHGDGTWTATGPDSMIEWLDATTFQITSPSAVWLDSETYRLSSW